MGATAAEVIELNSSITQFIRQPKKMFINGKWVTAESGKTFDVVNPATEEVIAQVPEG